jgi:hypothetical protein
MGAAAVGGFVLSQIMNARRAAEAPVATSAPARARPFDEKGARAATVAALNAAGTQCRPPVQPGGEIVASVWFVSSGRVSRAKIDDPLGQTATGACIAKRLSNVLINPFEGDAVSLSARVVVP